MIIWKKNRKAKTKFRNKVKERIAKSLLVAKLIKNMNLSIKSKNI